jgi:signal transduction histidine kinase
MDAALQDHISTIVQNAEALLREEDGTLDARQGEFIRKILANAEKFIHVATAFSALPPDKVSSELRHELGNPLTPMFGYSELLITRMMDTLNTAQKIQVQEIANSTSILRYIVDDLVNQARQMAQSSGV